jgi:predicted nucleotidyltransferase
VVDLGARKGRGRKHATPEEALEALHESRKEYEESEKGKARRQRYADAHRVKLNAYRRNWRKRKTRERARLRAAV